MKATMRARLQHRQLLPLLGWKIKDSHVSADLSDEDDESSDSDEDAGPPSMPGVPIERNTSLRVLEEI